MLGRSTFHRTLLSMGIFDGSSIVVTGMRVDAATVAVPAAPAAIDEEAGESEPGDAVARANDLPACIIAANVEYFNTLVSLLEGMQAAIVDSSVSRGFSQATSCRLLLSRPAFGNCLRDSPQTTHCALRLKGSRALGMICFRADPLSGCFTGSRLCAPYLLTRSSRC